jgi:potassium-transporting ATPase KdpC subunit
MLVHLRRSIVAVVAFTLVFGFIYALAGTGVAQVLFKHQANGSITSNGSSLVGQNWAQTKCPGHPLGSCVFQGRPDALGPYGTSDTKVNPVGHPGDNPLEANGVSGGSGATNLGPRSQTLLTNTQQLVQYWHDRGVKPTPDLVSTSGSGVDPDISVAGAKAQIPMVSKATGISSSALNALIDRVANGPQLGFLGSDYVNVLQLNEALAAVQR